MTKTIGKTTTWEKPIEGFSSGLTEVPASACQLAGDALELGQLAAADDDGKQDPTVPVTLTLLSGKPIQHWYWGKIAVDPEGMRKTHKASLPIDYVHNTDEVIGAMDSFEVTGGKLKASGRLVPMQAGDRASEVIYKSSHGVPYEASINFTPGNRPLQLQEVAEGDTAELSGTTFKGPGVIVREWSLRGAAICPYGADMHTNTKFSRSSETVPVSYLETPAMAKNANDNGDKTAPPETQTPDTPATPPQHADAAADERQFSFAEARRFKELFGANGSDWYVEGKTIEECYGLSLAERDAIIKARDEEITELKNKLQAADAATGETTPATASPVTDDGQRKSDQPFSWATAATPGVNVPNHAKSGA